jgi:hypothetical protein
LFDKYKDQQDHLPSEQLAKQDKYKDQFEATLLATTR